MNQPSLRPSERLIGTLLRASRAVEKRIEDALEGVELSLSKYSALKHLALAGEPLALSELASRLICVRSNITQLVDRLEADGLVRRVEDPKDRRSVRAELTALGRERQAAGARQAKAVQDELAERLAGLDCEAIEQALARLK
ncbi:MAG TPA: MarR family transcriptional regulator [Thermoanaerobaculia bacterium]|nr:MarR family transcriptional regulator [Thermoanaerobaculia bacterium]